MSNKPEEGAVQEAPKKSKKKLLIIVLGVVLLLGGGGAYFFLGTGEAHAEAEEKPEPGPIVAMDPVTINLEDGHFLRVAIALQTTADAEAELDGAKALDLTIALYNEKKLAELSTPAGRAKAKKELIEEVKEAYEDQVYDIYFKEFVTQ
ncbi:hypothetical protein GCM10010123_10050 [Pilimelia anulata]|uniref:Flagellar protein FliL n=1 Tax=Pilimelia anulata TaxID=53371 RepID=A0A8J3B2X4_9ACTN|nr:flagellar basal body-associated FliL family protein [Pilimelia anulata]GGJ82365.1 hypothetical protein GCM10010123_10050 [Pilimelia anulata]